MQSVHGATMREQFGATVTELLDREPRTALVLADIGVAQFAGAARAHPDRVVNVGIREQLMIGVAGGLALTGLRPVVHTFAGFLIERPFEQLKLDLCHQGVGAVLVSAGGSYDRSDEGRTHMSPGDVALLDTLPGWHVHVPGHPAEADLLLRHAVAADDTLQYVRLSEHRNAEPRPVAPGRFLTVRQGSRTAGTVLAVGPMLDAVLEAVGTLDVTVLYAATVRPFDAAGLRAAVGERADVVLVEPCLAGTSERAAHRALAELPHRVLSLGVPVAEHRHYGSIPEHLAAYGLDAAGLRARIAEYLW
ncbi:transketolase family protein [Kitasatospora sp. NPDC057198]|uniref:transketolase family protein n=1 Tax=Kitasatospora sp. NPDC057198 TaxID=3346046 RepID=UPI0036402C50